MRIDGAIFLLLVLPLMVVRAQLCETEPEVAIEIITNETNRCEFGQSIGSGVAQSFKVLEDDYTLDQVKVWIGPHSSEETLYSMEIVDGEGPKGPTIARSVNQVAVRAKQGVRGDYYSFNFLLGLNQTVLVSNQSYTCKLVPLTRNSGQFSSCSVKQSAGILYGQGFEPLPSFSWAFSIFAWPRKLRPGRIVYIQAVHNNNFVSIRSNTIRVLQADSIYLGIWERYMVMYSGFGTVGLQALGNNRFVSADITPTFNGKLVADRFAINAWEKFYEITAGGGQIALLAQSNFGIVSVSASLPNPLIAVPGPIGSRQKFRVYYHY